MVKIRRGHNQRGLADYVRRGWSKSSLLGCMFLGGRPSGSGTASGEAEHAEQDRIFLALLRSLGGDSGLLLCVELPRQYALDLGHTLWIHPETEDRGTVLVV